MNLNKFFKTLAICAAIWGIASSDALAQSKAETKLYNTVMTKRDLKNANKFLNKFPSSQYAPAVQKVKDSIGFYGLDKNDVTAYITFLNNNPKSFYASAANTRIVELNTSTISAEQALEAAVAAGLQKEAIAAATGVKNRNNEYVAVLAAPAASSKNFKLILLSNSNGTWSISDDISENIYTNDYELNEFALKETLKPVTIKGLQYLYFGYTNSSSHVDKRSNIANNDCELVLNLYSMDDKTVYNIFYSGKTQDGILYGSSMDAEQAGAGATEQQAYLISQLNQIDYLKPYEAERFMAQDLIQWWYKNNPANSKDVAFGLIPQNSPIIDLFSKSKDKEKVGNYTVAMIEHVFGNTIIVVMHNQTKEYALAMCQATPKNTNDLELNTFYGEKGNILALYYFKGKSSVKKRLNLASKKLY